jgi:hypothetical protein
MENRPSRDPRDVVARAAMLDAATLAGLVAGEFQATYPGSDRRAYLDALGRWLADRGGLVEDGPAGASATFDGRRIAIHFGPVTGHRQHWHVLGRDLVPQLVGNDGVRAMRRAIAEPGRFAFEPKVDGVRGMVSLLPGGLIEVRNRQGKVRDWFRRSPLPAAFGHLGALVPLVWEGTVLDGELTAGRFATTMAALYGAKAHAANLSFVVFDMPAFGGVDLRHEAWQQRRERLELLARAFERPLVLSPLVDPSTKLVVQMQAGDLEGIVIKERIAPYRPGSRAGWTKVKDRSWFEQEAWRFERR